MQCPKCHYRRQATDYLIHEGICPACGIAYSKWKPEDAGETDSAPDLSPLQRSDSTTYSDSQLEDSRPSRHHQRQNHVHIGTEEDAESYTFNERAAETFLHVPEEMDSMSFWGRAVILAGFTFWGLAFVFGGIHWDSINGSFLHAVNLPFHEFGHVFFSPLGRFMAILGGSLFQILVPIILLCAFSFKYRDNFAAAIMLWWCGQNFIDISPYIQDAEYRAMPLIMGMGEEAHDWGNLLSMMGQIEMCYAYAKVSFGIGTILMVAGISWGAYLLYKIKKQGLSEFSL